VNDDFKPHIRVKNAEFIEIRIEVQGNYKRVGLLVANEVVT